MSSTDLRARERELDEREIAIRLAEDELVEEPDDLRFFEKGETGASPSRRSAC